MKQKLRSEPAGAGQIFNDLHANQVLYTNVQENAKKHAKRSTSRVESKIIKLASRYYLVKQKSANHAINENALIF